MGWSEEQAKQILGDKYPDPEPRRKPAKSKQKKQKRPRPTHRPGRMNKTEAKFAERLTNNSQVLYWQFEPLTFRLAKRTNYTPDFMAVTQDEIWIIEVKGSYEREDARVKWKTAAEMYPMFRWFVARWIRSVWEVEEYG